VIFFGIRNSTARPKLTGKRPVGVTLATGSVYECYQTLCGSLEGTIRFTGIFQVAAMNKLLHMQDFLQWQTVGALICLAVIAVVYNGNLATVVLSIVLDVCGMSH
jgi:hypothetical protein